MLFCMRTTLNVDDTLMQEVKVLARRSGKTLTAVVEDALRERLARRAVPVRRAKLKLHTVDGHGLQPGVDLDDSAGLRDIMDGLS